MIVTIARVGPLLRALVHRAPSSARADPQPPSGCSRVVHAQTASGVGVAPDAHLELRNSREGDFLAVWRPTVGRLAGALKVEPENLVGPPRADDPRRCPRHPEAPSARALPSPTTSAGTPCCCRPCTAPYGAVSHPTAYSGRPSSGVRTTRRSLSGSWLRSSSLPSLTSHLFTNAWHAGGHSEHPRRGILLANCGGSTSTPREPSGINPAFCRTLRSGGTRIRTGDTMILVTLL
jgi:hypothetical protein